MPCRETLCVNDNIFVSTRYEKWVKCLWLLEHMSMIERSRRHERYSVKRIDAVYRLAFKCIFDSFIDVYETIRSDRYSRVCDKVFRLVKPKVWGDITFPGTPQQPEAAGDAGVEGIENKGGTPHVTVMWAYGRP